MAGGVRGTLSGLLDFGRLRLAARAPRALQHALLAGNILAIYAITFVALRLAAIHSFRLDAIPLEVSARLMGLLLAGIAVQFVIDGAREAAAGLRLQVARRAVQIARRPPA